MRAALAPALLSIAFMTGVACAVAQQAPSPGRIPLLDPNTTGFPAASIADYSSPATPPAGSRGFMFAGTDGRFYFQDGTRARFWGINVAKDSVFQPRPVIDAAVDAIVRAGFNLVRLHHLDDEEGLLPASLAGSAQRIDRSRLDALDYWIARLQERGVYVYLDLMSYRTFHEAEGVPEGQRLGRGAKPYAVFNERIIELQRDFARTLLFEHVNPYTGLTYAQDPAVCMVELCDENGLFRMEHRLGEMISPYREELVRRWNFWLVEEHGSREALVEAWGRGTLAETEDPRRGTVALPGVTAGADSALARVADRNRFFAGLHREYFRTLVDGLRERGLRVPVSAVTRPQAVPDLWAAAAELDFIATNYYYDHPYFRAGSEWQLPAFFSGMNALRDDSGASFAAAVGSARVLGMPLVVREWNVCWPNDSRGPGLLEAAALACLQDVDAMILFTLDARPQTRRLGYFDLLRDPTRWGLAPAAGRMFLEQHVGPARHTVAVARDAAETFHPEGQTLPTALYQVARVARTGNVFLDEADSAADVTVLAGRTAAPAYAGNQGVISADSPATDAYGRGRADAASRAGYPAYASSARDMTFTFGGTLFPAGARHAVPGATPFSTAAVQRYPDLRPVGLTPDAAYCLGIRDLERGNYVFGRLGDDLRLRVTLDALGQLFGLPVSHDYVDRRCYVADTDQVITDLAAGLLWVNGHLTHAVAGELGASHLVTSGPLAVETPSGMAACVWQSLDGYPAGRSRNWVLKYVTVARNEGQQVRVHLEKKDERILALDHQGGVPVLSLGRPSERPVTVSLDDEPLLSVFMLDGAFEMHRRDDTLWLYGDTPGVRWHLPRLGGVISAVRHSADGRRREIQLNQPFPWPAGAALLEIPNVP